MIYYIGYYNCDLIRKEGRIVAAASENKMNYMITALSEAYDGQIAVVTPAETHLPKFVKGNVFHLGAHVTLKTFSSFCSKYKILRVLGHFWTRFLFMLYLLMHVSKADHLVVYHSCAYMRFFRIFKALKKFALTLEVEELYADVTGDEGLRKKEIDYLQIADSYIFITELLQKEVNVNKTALISHGTYQAQPDYGFRFSDETIHVVYAGTFRKEKGGVYTAIAAAEYLDARFTLEVLGKGSEEENAAVQQLIYDISQKTDSKINYVGFKSGQDFNKYIQACHIGLSTQPVDAKFNATSFPSKVMMYMSNGLRVVSVRIPAVETSSVGDQIYYYDNQDPEEIAQIIRKVSFEDDYDSRAYLKNLHVEFVEQLKKLLPR